MRRTELPSAPAAPYNPEFDHGNYSYSSSRRESDYTSTPIPPIAHAIPVTNINSTPQETGATYATAHLAEPPKKPYASGAPSFVFSPPPPPRSAPASYAPHSQVEELPDINDSNRQETTDISCCKCGSLDWDVGKWVGVIIAGLLNCGIWATVLYFFVTMVMYDDNGDRKPFQGICLNPNDMKDYTCILSVGQMTSGIFCFGQINIGLICIGQVNVGVLFCIGQVAAGIGYSGGQVASGLFVHFAQLGFGMYEVRYCQVGVRFLKCFFPGSEEDSSTRGDAYIAGRCGDCN